MCWDHSADYRVSLLAHPLSRHYQTIGFHSPLHTRQDRRHIVCRTPSVLQDIQTQLSCTIDVRVEHLADELDSGRFVGVLFFEVHDESECAVFEGCV